MDNLIKIAKLIALLSVVPLVVFACLFLHQLTKTTAELQVTMKTVSTTANTLPNTVDARLASLQKDVLNKVDAVQDKLTGQVNVLAQTADKRLGSIETNLFSSVDDIRSDLNTQLTTTNSSVTKLTDAYSNVPTQVAARYDKDFGSFFDCKKNNLCLQGQASDTMFAIRDASRSTSLTMRGVKETLPKIEGHLLTVSTTFATDVPKITGNFASITGNIDRLTKPKWYDRLLGYGLNGAILYRNLNPATNLTITGVQAVAGGLSK